MAAAEARPKAVLSWSGGKDGCLALLRAAEAFDVVALVTMFGEDGARSRSHGLTPAVVRAQAARLRLPLYVEQGSWETYTDRFHALLAGAAGPGVSHVIFGDILGDAHRRWNEQVAAARGLAAVMPLWGEDTGGLAREFVRRGGEARLVTVRTPPLEPAWLGQVLDLPAIARLEALGVDACGEFGEYHTVVTNCPAFDAPLALAAGERVPRGDCWALDVRLA